MDSALMFSRSFSISGKIPLTFLDNIVGTLDPKIRNVAENF